MFQATGSGYVGPPGEPGRRGLKGEKGDVGQKGEEFLYLFRITDFWIDWELK